MRLRFPYLVGGLALIASLTATASAYADAPDRDAVPEYVRFEPLIVPIFDGGASAGLIGVQITLNTGSSGERRRLEQLRPRLTDAWLHALAEHGRLHVEADRAIDVEALRSVLMTAASPYLDSDTELLVVEAMAYAA